jgi:hypothetical protein
LARAFVVKAVLGFEVTRALIERLEVDSRLKRICGFSLYKKLPSEATFSRAFAEFAKERLAAKVHETLIKETLGDQLIGHVSRDSTAIHARERVQVKPVSPPSETTPPPTPLEAACQVPGKSAAVESVTNPAAEQTEETPAPTITTNVSKPRRGRPRKGEVRPAPPLGKVALQRAQTLPQMLAALPTVCDVGTKKNAKGFKESWKGYKLHLDTADCGIPLSAMVTSASMHDSLAAIPLAIITGRRVTHCYDLMDAAYCCDDIRAHSRSLNHVPLIDHNPRGGEKIEFLPHEAQRYKERSQVERSNARLKDEFGARQTWVRGYDKVSSHLMFGVLVLAADHLMRLLQ